MKKVNRSYGRNGTQNTVFSFWDAHHRHFKYLMGPIGLLTLVGCGQSLIYDATRDKMGQAAVKAASDVRLNDTVTAVDKRFEGLLALELDAAKVRTAHLRELEIREIAFKAAPIKDTWLARMQKRLSAIAGGTANWEQGFAIRTEIEVNQGSVNERQDGFRDEFSLAAPTCEEVIRLGNLPDSVRANIPTEKRSIEENFATQLLSSCKKLDESHKKLLAFPGAGSELDRANKQLEDDRKEKEKNNTARTEAQAKLKQAIDVYSSESKRLEKPTDQSTYTSRVIIAAQKLRQTIEGVEKTQNAFGSEVVAKERLDRIEEVLSALAKGDTDTSKWSDDLRKAMAITGSIPSLADDATVTLREAGKPRLTPLAIAREQQRLIVDEGVKVDNVFLRRIAASEKLVDAYWNELTTLLDIKKKIANEQDWDSKSLIQLNKDLKPDHQRRLLYELFGTYFDEIPRLQTEQRTWEYTRLATFYEETQERSKSAALMWQNSLDGIASTLATYHSTGIKPEDLARFIQALGVNAIGVGVNR